MRYADYPRQTVEDIARLRRRLDAANLPPRRTDHNLIIGTWNIQQFGRVHRSWEENPGSPKRNLRAMAVIAEIIRRFDVVAVQEVKRDTSGIGMLVEEFLAPAWSVILSDVSAGEKGNHERLVHGRPRPAQRGTRGSGGLHRCGLQGDDAAEHVLPRLRPLPALGRAHHRPQHQAMARTLGLHPAMPDPLGPVPA